MLQLNLIIYFAFDLICQSGIGHLDFEPFTSINQVYDAMNRCNNILVKVARSAS